MQISIKGIRKTLAVVVGTVQSTLGALAVAFSCFLYVNFFDLQEILKVPAGFLPLYMLILIVFGSFSIIGGLLLLTEGLELLQMEGYNR